VDQVHFEKSGKEGVLFLLTQETPLTIGNHIEKCAWPPEINEGSREERIRTLRNTLPHAGAVANTVCAMIIENAKDVVLSQLAKQAEEILYKEPCLCKDIRLQVRYLPKHPSQRIHAYVYSFTTV